MFIRQGDTSIVLFAVNVWFELWSPAPTLTSPSAWGIALCVTKGCLQTLWGFLLRIRMTLG